MHFTSVCQSCPVIPRQMNSLSFLLLLPFAAFQRPFIKTLFQGQNRSDLFDVGLTNYFFFRDEEKQLGKADRVSFFDYYKVNYTLPTNVLFVVLNQLRARSCLEYMKISRPYDSLNSFFIAKGIAMSAMDCQRQTIQSCCK